MSDDYERSNTRLPYNISTEYYTDFQQICSNCGDQPTTNLYYSYTDIMPALGTVYLIHGYGGSPVETTMLEAVRAALKSGFNTVVVECIELSATYNPYSIKDSENANIANLKKSIIYALAQIEANKIMNSLSGSGYKIVLAHSMGARALSDLVIRSNLNARHYAKIKDPQTDITKISGNFAKLFDKVILCNPYLLIATKVLNLQKRMSGETFKEFLKKSRTESRMIQGYDYKFTTIAKQVNLKLPSDWNAQYEDLGQIATTAAYHLNPTSKTPLHVILGTEDKMAEYAQNSNFLNALPFDLKFIQAINGANHFFDNKVDEYYKMVNGIFRDTRDEIILSQSQKIIC